MKNLKFIQIEKENNQHYEQLLGVCIPYLKEIKFDTKRHNMDLDEFVGVIADVQGTREDMHLELCYEENNIIGFCFYAVDLGGIKGLIEPNYGYIMEFYVLPQYRRQGYGLSIFKHVEKTFFNHGSEYMYLTPQKISGEKFWDSIGFKDSGKLDPDNHKPIYIKKVYVY